MVVSENDDVLVISDDGTVIRMAAADINVYSRVAQGVRIMRLADGAKVISSAKLEHDETEETAEE